MTALHGVARLRWEQARLMHYSSAARPASRRRHDDLSLTDPCSISLAFLGHCEAVVAKQGVTSTRRIVPGNIMLCGAEPIQWLGGTGSGASDFIEITASVGFRRELADELRVPAHVELDDLHGWRDPVVWGIAARFRSAARQAIVLDDLERDLLLRRLYARILETRFGGRDASRGHGGLEPVRLSRVMEFIEAHLEAQLTIAKLSEVAALSPFHFVRSFGKTFGLTPHRYVRARRLELARDLLVSGLTPRIVAQRVGYESFSHFRAAYRAHFGMTYEQDERLGGGHRR